MDTSDASIFCTLLQLDQFTFSLDSLPASEACTHCGQNDQWVSHGYVYKYQPLQGQQVAGKRILCSRRYGRTGCGHTRQLYLADIIPRLQYTLSTVIAFIQALLLGNPVEASFQRATQLNTRDTRQAWRWLKRFMHTLSTWRVVASLTQADEDLELAHRFSRHCHLSILLPTLSLLLPTIAQYQSFYQRSFF